MAVDPAQALLEFVRHNVRPDAGDGIDLDTPLISQGLVDSLGLTMIAAFVEETFDVRFDAAELRAHQLETVRAIAAVVARRAR